VERAKKISKWLKSDLGTSVFGAEREPLSRTTQAR
jgi:hypothetical protein